MMSLGVDEQYTRTDRLSLVLLGVYRQLSYCELSIILSGPIEFAN